MLVALVVFILVRAQRLKPVCDMWKLYLVNKSHGKHERSIFNAWLVPRL